MLGLKQYIIARCTSLIRQTHWQLCFKSQFSSYSCSVSSNQALRDARLMYAKHIDNLWLKSKFMSYSWSVSSNQAMRDARLSYAKHIGNFVSNPNPAASHARSQALRHCEMHSHTPNTLKTRCKSKCSS